MKIDQAAKNKQIKRVVAEESALLNRVRQHLRSRQVGTTAITDYDAELVALRDAITEARPEDIPPLVEQMTRMQALAAQRGLGDEVPVDPQSPYFGHLKLEEENSTRDVMLGKRTYLAPEADIRIVDWRNAPVSRMYYSYDEGDDYEEEFGGHRRRGRVATRRSVTIADGELKRIASPEEVYVLRRDKWLALDPDVTRLSGGQGTAIRAERLQPVRGVLGVDADGTDRRDKHLPEIAALLDRRQFDLITTSRSGLVIVRGGAGSGKTTVGLHRAAFLAYENPKRFRTQHMIVIVLNEGLAAYISRVLPALGVNGVQVMTYARWANQLRRRHVHGLPLQYSEMTPSVVSRLKKHPSLLHILAEIVDRTDEQLTEIFLDAVSGTPHAGRVVTAWQTLNHIPLDARRRRVLRWVKGEAAIGRDSGRDMHPRTARSAELILDRLGKKFIDIVGEFSDFFTDRGALQNAFELHAPSEFSDAELDQVHAWCVDIHASLEATEDDPPLLDREDDAILLRLHQLKRGWLRGRNGRLQYDHLMVDEAQDFSPLELKVLLETARGGAPLTLAGDTAQKIIRESGFSTWEELIADLGLKESKMASLDVAYRSTHEIMRLSQDILGPLAGTPPQAPRHGAPVEMHVFSDPGEVVGFLGTALRELALREPLANVAVIARHRNQALLYYEGLKKSEVPRLELVVDEDFSFTPGVEVTEIRQVKGLEFDYVILVEVGQESYPDTEESRHLLHVGATRAAHQLWLLSSSKPSPVLPRWLFEHK